MERNFLEEHIIRGTAELPVGIYSVDTDKVGPVPLHYHRECEFFAVTRGEADMKLAGNAVHLKASEGIFINSQTLHSSVGAGGDSGFSFTAIVFSPEVIAPEYDSLYKKYLDPVMKNELALSVRLPDEVIDVIAETAEIFNKSDPGCELAVKGNIIRMFSMCVANAERHARIKDDARSEIVKKTLDYIHANYSNPITLSDLASHAHVSREYLCRIFRSVSAVAPMAYLNRCRITQSTYMLRNTNKSISEISSVCGFNNGSYFDKMFMRFMNCTPSEYRRAPR